MLKRNLMITCVMTVSAVASQTAFPAGLTEEGARDIARVIQPSPAQLQVFSQPPTMTRAFRLSALAAPGLATTDAQKTFSMWHSFGLYVLAFDHTPAVDPTTGKQLHLQQFGPHRASYAMALLHLAMYEVANAFKTPPTQATSWIERKLPGAVGSPPAGASEAVAIAAAARTILDHLYMGDDYGIDSEYNNSLSGLNSAPGSPGEAFGNKIGDLILGLRSKDMSNLPEPMWGEDFSPKASTGTVFQWAPDPVSQIQVALGGNWGMVSPFVASAPSSYVLGNSNFPPPTYNLDDPGFIAAFNEVRKCGVDSHALNETRDCGVTGSLDNEDTYYRAKFWSYDGTSGICAPVRLYNEIADEILLEHKADIVGTASTDADVTAAEAKYYARINLAMVDAGIVAWYAKYLYQYWRPITGVRTLIAYNGGQSSTSSQRSGKLASSGRPEHELQPRVQHYAAVSLLSLWTLGFWRGVFRGAALFRQAGRSDIQLPIGRVQRQASPPGKRRRFQLRSLPRRPLAAAARTGRLLHAAQLRLLPNRCDEFRPGQCKL